MNLAFLFFDHCAAHTATVLVKPTCRPHSRNSTQARERVANCRRIRGECCVTLAKLRVLVGSGNFPPFVIAKQLAQFSLCVALIASTWSCSDGKLDAFTRQTQATPSGGAGTHSGGVSGGSAGASSGGAGNNSGGKSASGGAPNTGPLLIDDLEDGDSQTVISGGWWYMQNDRSGTGQALYGADTSRAGSPTRAVHASGSGFNAWFFVGLDLPGQPNLDASAFSRVTFLARAEAASVARTLSVDVLDSTSINVQDSTALHFRSSVELGNEWTTFSLPLREFVPTEGDATLRVNRAELSAIEFWVFSPEAFDFWLDDLTFEP
jgi:hypothetical protein